MGFYSSWTIPFPRLTYRLRSVGVPMWYCIRPLNYWTGKAEYVAEWQLGRKGTSTPFTCLHVPLGLPFPRFTHGFCPKVWKHCMYGSIGIVKTLIKSRNF